MADIFDVESLLPLMVLALGVAMIVGNVVAWLKYRKGEAPKGVDAARFRPGRVVWMLAVGTILSLWAGITLLT